MTCNPVSRSNHYNYIELDTLDPKTTEPDVGGIPFDNNFIAQQEKLEALEKLTEELTCDWKDHITTCSKCKIPYVELNDKYKKMLDTALTSLGLQNKLYFVAHPNLLKGYLKDLSRLFLVEQAVAKELNTTSSKIYKHVSSTVFSEFSSFRKKVLLDLIRI